MAQLESAATFYLVRSNRLRPGLPWSVGVKRTSARRLAKPANDPLGTWPPLRAHPSGTPAKRMPLNERSRFLR